MAVQDVWVYLNLCGIIFIAQATCLQLAKIAPQLSFKRNETNVWGKLRWKQTGVRKECWKNFEEGLQITNSPLFLQWVLLKELGRSKWLFYSDCLKIDILSLLWSALPAQPSVCNWKLCSYSSSYSQHSSFLCYHKMQGLNSCQAIIQSCCYFKS